MRYVHYYDHSLKHGVPPEHTYQITHIRLVTTPNFDTGGGCDPYFHVKMGGKTVFNWMHKATVNIYLHIFSISQSFHETVDLRVPFFVREQNSINTILFCCCFFSSFFFVGLYLIRWGVHEEMIDTQISIAAIMDFSSEAILRFCFMTMTNLAQMIRLQIWFFFPWII